MDLLATTPDDLLATRLALVRDLATSLETSQFALVRNDAEMIALGAARQAELCRRWGLLEDQLGRVPAPNPHSPGVLDQPGAEPMHSTRVADEFAALIVRIRHLTRIHCSLLRHLQRSLAILTHVTLDRSAPTYTPPPSALHVDPRLEAGD